MIFILAALGSVPLVGALLVLVVARQWVILISLSALCVLLAGIPAIYAAVGYDPSGTSEPGSRSGTVCCWPAWRWRWGRSSSSRRLRSSS